MDKIHAMQLFIRVADLESFSRAAETRRYLRVASRDRFRPRKPSWRASPAPHHPPGPAHPDGMVYYERAKDLLSNLDELDGMFQHDPASISGRLRVDMPVGFAKMVIPHLPTFYSSIRASNWS